MSGTSERAGFVGRERELARIAASLESAAAGERTSLLIAGAGVVGVGRLVNEVVARVGSLPTPFVVIRARAHSGRSDLPYAPLAEPLEAFLLSLDDNALATVVGRSAPPLIRILAGLRPRFEAAGLLDGRELDIPSERRVAWTADAIRGVLARA